MGGRSGIKGSKKVLKEISTSVAASQMVEEPIVGSVALDDNGRNFWTFGEKLEGVLKLRSYCDKPITVRFIQGSVLCEEWVHTVHLEFREHYRETRQILEPQRHSFEMRPGESRNVVFKLDIPCEKIKKHPPSFAFKYNNVAWCAKFTLGYSLINSEDIRTAQIEQNFRVCTIPPAGSRWSQSSTADPVYNEFSWTPEVGDFKVCYLPETEGAAEALNAALRKASITFRLQALQCGIIQSNAEEGPPMGIRVQAEFKGDEALVMTRLEIGMIEMMHTYGKDSLLIEKPIAQVEQHKRLRPGINDLDSFVEGVQVHELTEDFKTEWQQITHTLRLGFNFSLPSCESAVAAHWQVPVCVLSEAEAIKIERDAE